MPFPFPELHNFQNSCLYHEDEDIYVEDATKVESIGKIIMEKYDLLKKLQQNLQNPVSGPDAHSSVMLIVSFTILLILLLEQPLVLTPVVLDHNTYMLHAYMKVSQGVWRWTLSTRPWPSLDSVAGTKLSQPAPGPDYCSQG